MLLIAYDGSDNAKAAIDAAAKVAPGAVATVLTTWEPYSGTLARAGAGGVSGMAGVAFPDLDEQARATAERVAAEGAELAAAAGLHATARTAETNATSPAPLIIEIADELEVDAIVVGTRGHGRVKSMVLGSTSHGVLGHATRPVLLVPPTAG
ncbi:MAG: universal stress protein [Solirubrobacteraceae bacterium]|nr:universal stress protein [Solirubrobacteraceae bacterium]